jgi:hypothetical protein
MRVAKAARKVRTPFGCARESTNEQRARDATWNLGNLEPTPYGWI